MKLNKKTWCIIAAVAVIIVIAIVLIVSVKSRGAGDSSNGSVVSAEYVYPSGTAESKAEYDADPAQKGELLLADESLTNKERSMGRSWYRFDAEAEITSESYNFLPDGTYTYQYKYSLAAGGKFVYDKGTYSVPEKGSLILYPDGEMGIKYDYKIENNELFLRKKGTEEWSQPFTMSDN